MTNVKLEVKGNKLIAEIDLTESHGASKSGKTEIIGTTHGFESITDSKGNSVMVSINVNRRIS